MYRDDSEWLRTRVAELEEELAAARQEIARLQDQLPENASAVLARAVEMERAAVRAQVLDLQEKLRAAEARLTSERPPPQPAREQSPEERRRDQIAFILVLAVAVLMFAAIIIAVIMR